MNEGLLSVKNSLGRQVSLLNSSETVPANDRQQDTQQSKRKYHCIEPGCNKSFTTSGHLARHNRIHTGEKNFPCLFPGCQSRFSRQDNMMQHYKTHMSPKSKRSQKRGLVEDIRPRPRLHAHHRIRSDPVRVQPPLTIDQHLSNYHESLKTTNESERHDFPVPLSSIPRSPLHIVNNPSSITPSPTLSPSSSATTTSFNQIEQQQDDLFYQHRPLRWAKPTTHFPYTLLHPTQRQEQKELSDVAPNQMSGNSSPDDKQQQDEGTTNNEKSASSDGLLQLAHIVSTFG